MKKITFLLLGILLSSVYTLAQYADTIYSPKIKSVKFFAGDDQLSYPVLVLNSGNILQLHFDIMESQPQDLQYSFVHCSWDWREEDIYESDFIDGYYVNDILDYKQSFNTHVSYVTYKIVFPNENVNLTVSGNYIIKVFLRSNPDSVLFQKRFFVVEDNVPVQTNIHQSTIASLRPTHQEVDFTIDIGGLQIETPWNYIKASIYQNFRFDMARFLDQPKFYQGSQMIYDYEYENSFPGGNEFRNFNSSQFRYQSGKIFKYAFTDSTYFCYLLPDNIN